MSRRRVAIALVAGLVAALGTIGVAALRSRSPLPPLPPEPSTFGFVRPVAAQIQEAYAEAIAHPKDARAIGRVGMLLYAYSQPTRALPWYERARSLAPADARWTYFLAAAQHAAGDSEAAVAGFRRFLRDRPDYTPGRTMLGTALLAAGHAEESRQTFVDLVAREPGSRHAHYGLGRALAALGQAEIAVGHLERAAAGPPEFAAARYALSLAYRDAGRADAAREALARYRENPGAELDRADPLLGEVMALDVGPAAYRRRAISLWVGGRRVEAAAELEALTRLDPTDDNAHSDLIDLYAQLQQWDRAEEHYRAAVALRPTSRHAHFNWGALLLRRERFAEAAQVFTRVLELDPEDAPAHVRLGQALEKQGATREAAKHYRRAIDIDPGNREARYLIGLQLLAEGKPDAAVGHLERTLSPIDARTPRFMRQLGLAHARAGNRDVAIHHLREARRLAEVGRQPQIVARIAADLRELDRTSTERR